MKDATFACGFTDASPPWELVKAWMCEKFGVLPSQLNEEPVDELLRAWQLLGTYNEAYGKRKVR